MKRIATAIMMVSILVLSISGMAAAQGRHGMGFGNSDDFEQRMKNLENLRLLKLLETLELTEEQNTKFISAFATFRTESKDVMEKVEAAVDDLSEYLKQDDKTDNDILKKVDTIVNLKQEFEKVRANFFNHVKTILTAEQMGKMMVFQERFERQMLEKVRGFRAPGFMPNPDNLPDNPPDGPFGN